MNPYPEALLLLLGHRPQGLQRLHHENQEDGRVRRRLKAEDGKEGRKQSLASCGGGGAPPEQADLGNRQGEGQVHEPRGVDAPGTIAYQVKIDLRNETGYVKYLLISTDLGSKSYVVVATAKESVRPLFTLCR